MKKKEYSTLVDKHDNIIGKETREEVRKKNLLHRGAAIIVLNSKKEILIHKRPKNKDIYPNCIAFFFGGGQIYGETYEQTARRELEEEAGLKDVELEFQLYELFETDKDKCFVKLYSCVSDGPFKFDGNEIEEPRFVSLEKLKEVMKKEKFAEDDVFLFKKYLEKTSS